MRIFAYAKTKAQISCAVTAHLISAIVFATQIVHSGLFFLNTDFKPLETVCGCTAWFVLDLVGNPVDRFSCYAAHSIHKTPEDLSSKNDGVTSICFISRALRLTGV